MLPWRVTWWHFQSHHHDWVEPDGGRPRNWPDGQFSDFPTQVRALCFADDLKHEFGADNIIVQITSRPGLTPATSMATMLSGDWPLQRRSD